MNSVEGVPTRSELLAPYRHPYRHWLPRVWRLRQVRGVVAAGGIGVAVGLVGWLASGSDAWAALAAVAAGLALVTAATWIGQAALTVRRRVRRWDAPHELGAVRARRPHALEADPNFEHNEYAVTVESTGHLLVWKFVPLSIDENVPEGAVEVPGRPRFAATVVREEALPEQDTADAAEQLAAVQAVAADLEEHDREGAVLRHDRQLDEQRHIEAAGTAAALRSVTGQDGEE